MRSAELREKWLEAKDAAQRADVAVTEAQKALAVARAAARAVRDAAEGEDRDAVWEAVMEA